MGGTVSDSILEEHKAPFHTNFYNSKNIALRSLNHNFCEQHVLESTSDLSTHF